MLLPDLAAEQEYLTTLYKDVTHSVPVILEEEEGMPLTEIYSPLLIDDDLDAMKRTRRPDEPSGFRKLENISEVFCYNEKQCSRIFMKGEAGSGKTVFCLKLAESWSHLKQQPKHEHVCDKESELVNQIEMDSSLPYIIWELHNVQLYSQMTTGKMPCSTCEMQQSLSQFDLLYYVPLRDAPEGKEAIMDLICHSVCNEVEDLINRTRNLLGESNVRSLIILDGVDEWPTRPGYDLLPNIRGLSMNCVLLITLRPWKMVHLTIKPKHDDHIVRLNGLSSSSVAKVIEKLLRNFYRMEGDALKARFLRYCRKVEDESLEELLRMPKILIAACHLWQGEDPTTTCIESSDVTQSFSKTQFYLSLLNEIIKSTLARRRDGSKQNAEGSKQNAVASFPNVKQENPTNNLGTLEILRKFPHLNNLIQMLLPFCKLAYDDLVSTDSEARVLFFKNELERKFGLSQVHLAQKLGLVNQVKVRGKYMQQNVGVSFYHKSVQELMAAMHLASTTPDMVTAFCEYVSTLKKVKEMGNVVMFAHGLDPVLGCRLSKHVIDIVNADTTIQDYRRTLRTGCGRVRQLYHTQCGWYRELRLRHALISDTSPLPAMHVSDVYLDITSDNRMVQVTCEIMCSNLDNIVSVWLEDVLHPHLILQCLPQCLHLSVLCITDTKNKEANDLLLAVMPQLSQLSTIRYSGHVRSTASVKAAVVKAIFSLPQIENIELCNVDLYDDGLLVPCDLTRLQTIRLWGLHMSGGSWDRFVSSLLTLQHALTVTLDETNIDDETIGMVLNSPHFTVVRDDRERDEDGWYLSLEFSTRQSHST